MASLRRGLCLPFLLLGLIGCFLVVPPRVSATTGPTQFLPPAKFKVNNKIELLYTGQYILKSVATTSRLYGGAMGIEINNRGDLYGVSQFYGYDQQGHQDTWTATLYNFRLTNTLMSIDLVGPTGKPLLARLYVTRAAAGNLIGQIELAANSRFAITWLKLTSK